MEEKDFFQGHAKTRNNPDHENSSFLTRYLVHSMRRSEIDRGAGHTHRPPMGDNAQRNCVHVERLQLIQ